MGNSFTNSIFLRTKADLYEGWSSNVDLGFTLEASSSTGGDVTNSTFRLSTNVDPNSTTEIRHRLPVHVEYRDR